jgi:DNA uptake protein ComE-like DNA-binding protein
LQADGSSVVPDSLHVHSPQRPLLIDINVADSVSFTRLYGIGGYYARKIIEYRERLGNFYSTAQLMEIPGIDSVRFNGFAKRVTADPAAVRSFSLDTAGKYFLTRHPYVGAYAARGILLMREKFGAGACTIENLVKERILSPQIAEKLRHYISGYSF